VMFLSSTTPGLSASFASSVYAATMGIKPSLASSNDYVAARNFSFDRSADHSRGKRSKRCSGQLGGCTRAALCEVTNKND
jgi:hypothetical protein